MLYMEVRYVPKKIILDQEYIARVKKDNASLVDKVSAMEQKIIPCKFCKLRTIDKYEDLANLRAMCYTFISFALWLETQSHGVHSVFFFRYLEFSFLLRCEMQNRRYINLFTGIRLKLHIEMLYTP